MPKLMLTTLATVTAMSSLARAELPMKLACDPSIKIVASEIGKVGTYEVQIGMKKEEHTALLERKPIKPVDGCAFTGITPGQTVTLRYTGPQLGELEVQCIDLANNNAEVTFPKSIYTVRNANLSPYMLMPYCPDGKSSVAMPCSKKTSQSERGSEYKDTVLKWKENNPKTKQFNLDMVFDPPYRNSVPSNAKLFCALVTRDGKVAMAGTAQYPESTPDARGR